MLRDILVDDGIFKCQKMKKKKTILLSNAFKASLVYSMKYWTIMVQKIIHQDFT